jgi:hypothetical protein
MRKFGTPSDKLRALRIPKAVSPQVIFQAIIIVAALIGQLPKAHAVTTYNYTGPNYTSASGPYTTSMEITGNFSLATPLLVNLVLIDITSSLLSFTYNDGVNTYSSLDPNIAESFQVGTDSGGNIDEWKISISDPSSPSFLTNVGDKTHAMRSEKFSTTNSDQAIEFTCIQLSFISPGCGSAFVSGQAKVSAVGIWTSTAPISSVPEPSSLILLGFSLLATVAIKQYRTFRACA